MQENIGTIDPMHMSLDRAEVFSGNVLKTQMHLHCFMKKFNSPPQSIPYHNLSDLCFKIIAGKLPIVIDWQKCMGCGVCVSKCPNQALSLVRDERKGIPLDVRMLAEEESSRDQQ